MTCDASVIIAAKAFEKGYAEGYEEGFEEGIKAVNVEIILRKHQDGKSPESIAESLYVPVSYVIDILDHLPDN